MGKLEERVEQNRFPFEEGITVSHEQGSDTIPLTGKINGSGVLTLQTSAVSKNGYNGLYSTARLDSTFVTGGLTDPSLNNIQNLPIEVKTGVLENGHIFYKETKSANLILVPEQEKFEFKPEFLDPRVQNEITRLLREEVQYHLSSSSLFANLIPKFLLEKFQETIINSTVKNLEKQVNQRLKEENKSSLKLKSKPKSFEKLFQKIRAKESYNKKESIAKRSETIIKELGGIENLTLQLLKESGANTKHELSLLLNQEKSSISINQRHRKILQEIALKIESFDAINQIDTIQAEKYAQYVIGTLEISALKEVHKYIKNNLYNLLPKGKEVLQNQDKEHAVKILNIFLIKEVSLAVNDLRRSYVGKLPSNLDEAKFAVQIVQDISKLYKSEFLNSLPIKNTNDLSFFAENYAKILKDKIEVQINQKFDNIAEIPKQDFLEKYIQPKLLEKIEFSCTEFLFNSNISIEEIEREKIISEVTSKLISEIENNLTPSDYYSKDTVFSYLEETLKSFQEIIKKEIGIKYKEIIDAKYPPIPKRKSLIEANPGKVEENPTQTEPKLARDKKPEEINSLETNNSLFQELRTLLFQEPILEKPLDKTLTKTYIQKAKEELRTKYGFLPALYQAAKISFKIDEYINGASKRTNRQNNHLAKMIDNKFIVLVHGPEDKIRTYRNNTPHTGFINTLKILGLILNPRSNIYTIIAEFKHARILQAAALNRDKEYSGKVQEVLTNHSQQLQEKISKLVSNAYQNTVNSLTLTKNPLLTHEELPLKIFKKTYLQSLLNTGLLKEGGLLELGKFIYQIDFTKENNLKGVHDLIIRNNPARFFSEEIDVKIIGRILKDINQSILDTTKIATQGHILLQDLTDFKQDIKSPNLDSKRAVNTLQEKTNNSKEYEILKKINDVEQLKDLLLSDMHIDERFDVYLPTLEEYNILINYFPEKNLKVNNKENKRRFKENLLAGFEDKKLEFNPIFSDRNINNVVELMSRFRHKKIQKERKLKSSSIKNATNKTHEYFSSDEFIKKYFNNRDIKVLEEKDFIKILAILGEKEKSDSELSKLEYMQSLFRYDGKKLSSLIIEEGSSNAIDPKMLQIGLHLYNLFKTSLELEIQRELEFLKDLEKNSPGHKESNNGQQPEIQKPITKEEVFSKILNKEPKSWLDDSGEPLRENFILFNKEFIKYLNTDFKDNLEKNYSLIYREHQETFDNKQLQTPLQILNFFIKLGEKTVDPIRKINLPILNEIQVNLRYRLIKEFRSISSTFRKSEDQNLKKLSEELDLLVKNL